MGFIKKDKESPKDEELLYDRVHQEVGKNRPAKVTRSTANSEAGSPHLTEGGTYQDRGPTVMLQRAAPPKVTINIPPELAPIPNIVHMAREAASRYEKVMGQIEAMRQELDQLREKIDGIQLQTGTGKAEDERGKDPKPRAKKRKVGRGAQLFEEGDTESELEG